MRSGAINAIPPLCVSSAVDQSSRGRFTDCGSSALASASILAMHCGQLPCLTCSGWASLAQGAPRSAVSACNHFPGAVSILWHQLQHCASPVIERATDTIGSRRLPDERTIRTRISRRPVRSCSMRIFARRSAEGLSHRKLNSTVRPCLARLRRRRQTIAVVPSPMKAQMGRHCTQGASAPGAPFSRAKVFHAAFTVTTSSLSFR